MFLPALVLVVAVSGAPPAVVNRFEKPIRGSYIVRVKDSANPKELSTEFLKPLFLRSFFQDGTMPQR